MEVEIGGLFFEFRHDESILTELEDLYYPHPDTPIMTDNPPYNRNCDSISKKYIPSNKHSILLDSVLSF